MEKGPSGKTKATTVMLTEHADGPADANAAFRLFTINENLLTYFKFNGEGGEYYFHKFITKIFCLVSHDFLYCAMSEDFIMNEEVGDSFCLLVFYSLEFYVLYERLSEYDDIAISFTRFDQRPMNIDKADLNMFV